MTTRLADREASRTFRAGRMATPPGMSALETAAGAPYGCEETAPSPVASNAISPLAALQDALLPALRQTPCMISFSGGRDSSALLAVALGAARAHGLPDPVPVTTRFPDHPGTDETDWQERVVAYLGVNDWERIELDEELDYLGPLTRDRLLRRGPMFPANACVIVPAAERAAGGSLVVGFGGDELFGNWDRRRLADVLAGRERASVRDAAQLAFSLAPRGVRRRVLRRRSRPRGFPWLQPDAQQALVEIEAAEKAAEPVRWDRWTGMVPRHRYVAHCVRTMRELGAEVGACVSAPLVDPAFAAALGRAGGWPGWAGRTAALQAVFGAVLPRDVIERRDKARFRSVVWGRHARDFAESWSGHGLDETVVDAEAVRRTWLFEPHQASTMLLHAAWLHDHGAAA